MSQVAVKNFPGEMAGFVRSVELGGFSAAARELKLTPSALSKMVTRLEDRLGVRLINRTTRKLHLTPEGEAFFVRGQRILAEIEEAEAEVAGFRDRPRGMLRLHSGVAFALHQLAAAIPRFLERYPEIELDVTVTDHVLDLIDAGADLAIRVGTLPDSSLHARKICDLERVICAAPSYLDRHGTPRTPEALAHHNCIWITAMPGLKLWPFDTPAGLQVIEVAGSVAANNAETVLQLAVMGVGVVRLADIIVGEPIQKGELVPILTDSHHVEPLPMHAVYPHGKHRSPKVAAMVGFLIDSFAHTPWRSKPSQTVQR